MARRRTSLLHVKPVRVKGREYLYFRTGKTGGDGKEILTRLPFADDPGFGASYASCLAARSRRDAAASILTFPQLCDLWEKSPRWTMTKQPETGGTAKKKGKKPYAEGTKKLYRISLAYAKKQLPTAPAGLIEQQDIARLMDERADNPGAANSILRTINSLYKWGRERGHVTNDPGKDIQELEVGEHDPWPEHVLEAALKADDDLVRLGTHLLFYLAQRIEDTVKFTASILQGELAVIQQKTGTPLRIPLHAKLKEELARHDFELGYLLRGSRQGRHMTQKKLREALQAFAAKMGHDVVPHGLRKNAVNALLEAGCSAAQTAAVSGQSLSMVEHYAKLRAQGKLASAAVLLWENSAGTGKLLENRS